jgi:hypothetical protein
MDTCFVIQPFDGGTFDKRFRDVFDHAIKEAGLEPYRVDEDAAASIPVAAIEQRIRPAAVCFAEITKDNPNVWLELGFALANGKEVVMVCEKNTRVRFPFDVQHRAIITYETDAPSDFTKLKENISKRLRAVLTKARDVAVLAATPLKESEGLRPHEIVCLALIMEGSDTPGHWLMQSRIAKDMERAGYTPLAATLALRGLREKGYVATQNAGADDGELDLVYRTSPAGEGWLLANQEKLQLRIQGPASADDLYRRWLGDKIVELNVLIASGKGNSIQVETDELEFANRAAAEGRLAMPMRATITLPEMVNRDA